MERIEKPWGHELVWASNAHHLGKRLFVRAGERLSLQYHRKKDETIFLEQGESIRVPPGTIHRIEAVADSVLFEVSTPHPVDVVRVEDDYGRKK